ncbi:tRNA (uridine(34)/cytosine(34)/5-carboxymethylaminomethyluridine(34)-2'-O)-methyltransferase TrmL [Alphaproteobacteria bacterium]|nr:tRNA (uridine(34)/cytosine(34)/5-carboxymethylaminomethyluridine(34)-2'-O)-methyltransferase TrmL [Alphaproteobacteria bacterium]
MINIILYNPQIPPNTGNIMRLCANTGFSLHIIEPVGFPLDDKSLKRAKLDYFSDINPIIYKDYKSFIDVIDERKIYAVTKFGTKIYSEIKYDKDVFLLFGSETTGLPKAILGKLKNRSIKIPMINESRSLNLSNSVAIIVYEIWRQSKFSGANLLDNI